MTEFFVKKFSARDVFYNNGLVNLYGYIKRCNLDECECDLTSAELVVKTSMGNEESLYYQLLDNFIVENQIVHLTDNDRLYWWKEKNRFVIDKKFDVEGKSSPNDVKYLYDNIKAGDLNLTTEELYNLYNEFIKDKNVKPKEKEEHKKYFFDKDNENLKGEDKVSIPLYMTIEKAVSNFSKYLVKNDILPFDSKIHQFEDGGDCFKDMLINKDCVIDKWDALVYWYGSRIGRFFSSAYYIYLNSLDLASLYLYKSNLDISNKKAKYKVERTGEIKEANTNVNTEKQQAQLGRDGIKNSAFFISNSQQEFQLKFFMYLFSSIYHIKDDYETKIKDERRKRGAQELYRSIHDITFVTYTEDGALKSSLSEYTRAYRLFQLFEKLVLCERESGDGNQLKYFGDLITAIKRSKPDKAENNNIKVFCENILSFRLLRSNYYEASFDILRDDEKRTLGKGLYLLEKIYLEFLERSEIEMSLHERSQKLGEEIGLFAADIREENLLYKLRGIKNYKQFVAYISELKFTVLKHSKKQNEGSLQFTKEFNETLLSVLNELEKEQKQWELVRDYVAIYAIDKYRSVSYAKSKKGEK